MDPSEGVKSYKRYKSGIFVLPENIFRPSYLEMFVTSTLLVRSRNYLPWTAKPFYVIGSQLDCSKLT